jgi:hypothetical protein
MEKRLDSTPRTSSGSGKLPPSSTHDLPALIKDAIEVESKKANAVLFGLDERDDVGDLESVRKLVADADAAGLQPEDVIRVFRDGPVYNGSLVF